jgi:TDG/mug DNA glycosylase family protein
MFWYLLNRAGLLNEMESDLKNDESLKRIYDEKFIPQYGLNFVNLVNRPTVDVTELEKGEEQMGVRRTIKLIRTHRPKVVCFIGKVTFNKFHGSREHPSLSDAFSNPRAGLNPRGRFKRCKTSGEH